MARFVVLDPTAKAEPLPDGGLAPRPADLAGRRIGLLDNSKLNSGATLDLIAGLLAERYAGIEFVRMRKPTSAKPLPPEMVEQARRTCDLVIAGVGD